MKNTEKQDVTLAGNFIRGDERQVKGFLSFNSEDNSFESFPPESFDIKSFLQKGTVLYNHKLWTDENQNAIPVGKCQDITLVKILEIPDNNEYWAVKSIEANEIIDLFPKEKIPNAASGDRGLWVVASIEVPEVWQRVLRKKLTGFSWSGSAVMGLLNLGKKISKKVSALVSMVEISLVFSPQHPNAMLVPVMKSAIMDAVNDKMVRTVKSGKDHGLFGFVFSSGLFDKNTSKEWLKVKGFDNEDEDFVELSDGEFVYLQTGTEAFTNDLKTVGVEQGVQAIIGVLDASTLDLPEKDEIFRLTQKLLGGKVQTLAVENKEKSMKDAVKKTEKEEVTSVEEASQEVMNAEATEVEVTETIKEATDASNVENETVHQVADSDESKLSDTPIEQSTVEPAIEAGEGDAVGEGTTEKLVEDAPITMKQEEAVLSQVLADKLSVITNTVVESVQQKLDSIVATVNDNIVKMGEAVSKLVDIATAQSEAVMSLDAESAAVEMAKSEVTEVVDSIKKVDLQEEVLRLRGQVDSIMKTAVGSTIPEEIKKEEKPANPNDVFGGAVWPFKR